MASCPAGEGPTVKRRYGLTGGGPTVRRLLMEAKKVAAASK